MVRAAMDYRAHPGGGEAYRLEMAARELVRAGRALHNLFAWGDNRAFCLRRVLYVLGFTYMCPRFGLTGKGRRAAEDK